MQSGTTVKSKIAILKRTYFRTYFREGGEVGGLAFHVECRVKSLKAFNISVTQIASPGPKKTVK